MHEEDWTSSVEWKLCSIITLNIQTGWYLRAAYPKIYCIEDPMPYSGVANIHDFSCFLQENIDNLMQREILI